jgi:phosphatidylserine/phosphatidylglycerophosphate/cardiolipin synthase-like enzyme
VKYNEKLVLILAGVVLGVITGVSVYQTGVDNACPSKTCADAAEITPVVDRGYFDHAYRIISQARVSIHIASFEMKYYETFPDSQQNQLVRQLIYAKERGVDVKIVVDEFSEENNAFELLKENGIEMKHDGNETTTHAKLIIVDGKIVLVGSTNLSYYGLEKNHEANVLIEDEEVAAYYEGYFQELWGK